MVSRIFTSSSIAQYYEVLNRHVNKGAVWVVLAFGLLGYVLRKRDVSILPFVIGFILAPRLEELVRGGYSASGADALFLLKSPLAVTFLVLAAFIMVYAARSPRMRGT